MKSIRLLCFALLIVSIREVSGEKQAEIKCDPSSYKCGDLCTFEDWSCSCGSVTLAKNSPHTAAQS